MAKNQKTFDEYRMNESGECIKVRLIVNKYGDFTEFFESIDLEEANKAVKKWRKKNREEYNKYQSEYKKNNRNRVNKWARDYYSRFPDRVKRRNDRRTRNMDSIPINGWFEGCEGHHINSEYVIYIPKDLHRSIYHELESGKGMDIINMLVVKWLDDLRCYKWVMNIKF